MVTSQRPSFPAAPPDPYHEASAGTSLASSYLPTISTTDLVGIIVSASLQGRLLRPAHPRPTPFLPPSLTSPSPFPCETCPPPRDRETKRTAPPPSSMRSRLLGALRIQKAQISRSGATPETSPNSLRTQKTRYASTSGIPPTATQTTPVPHGVGKKASRGTDGVDLTITRGVKNPILESTRRR